MITVEMVTENSDGSADCLLHIDSDGMKLLLQVVTVGAAISKVKDTKYSIQRQLIKIYCNINKDDAKCEEANTEESEIKKEFISGYLSNINDYSNSNFNKNKLINKLC